MRIGLEMGAAVQEAFETAVQKHGKDAHVIVMPCGGSTFPYVAQENDRG